MLFLKLLVTVLYSQRVYLLSYLPIILPCIFTKLSPLNFVFVIMDTCLSNILESTKWIEMELGL